ncbi:unnamed protein product [Adineta ricciae]|uniref:Uncharacterized protein n=1 Tax=Adineta ricciae TaxID=249248 RepID=A0A816AEY8_ADIRI|nr:unnamed protein product [Adineta ricciae]
MIFIAVNDIIDAVESEVLRRSQARLQKEEGGHTAEAARTGKPAKTGMKPMKSKLKSTAHATAFGAADAPALGIQDAGEKLATGQRKGEREKKLITTRAEVKIAAWNVRTRHYVGQKEIIARELSRCKVSIAALTELRITGSGTTTIQHTPADDTMMLYYSRGQKREAGVGFMVNSQAAKSVIAFQPISDRLAILTIDGTIKTHIVAIYAPTETSPDPKKDDFYNQLQHAFDSIPQTEAIVLAGDFNAHIDHYLVKATIQLRLQRAKKKSSSSVRLDWRQLTDPIQKQAFQIALSNRFAALAQSENVDMEERQNIGHHSGLCQTPVSTHSPKNAALDIERMPRLAGRPEKSEISQSRTEFFEELYNHEPPQGPPADPPRIDPPTTTMPADEPTIEEVKTAIQSLRNGKAPGADHVTAEAIKAGGNVLLHRLHALLQTIWHTEQIPSTWKKAIIVPIHKKGDNSECKHYRGISLLSISAFDCIHWSALWKTLETEYVPLKIIKLLQTSYNGSTSHIPIRNESSGEFSIRTGVRQGDVVSPILFNVVIDDRWIADYCIPQQYANRTSPGIQISRIADAGKKSSGNTGDPWQNWTSSRDIRLPQMVPMETD